MKLWQNDWKVFEESQIKKCQLQLKKGKNKAAGYNSGASHFLEFCRTFSKIEKNSTPSSSRQTVLNALKSFNISADEQLSRILRLSQMFPLLDLLKSLGKHSLSQFIIQNDFPLFQKMDDLNLKVLTQGTQNLSITSSMNSSSPGHTPHPPSKNEVQALFEELKQVANPLNLNHANALLQISQSVTAII